MKLSLKSDVKFNYSTRVHTFGIGSGASAYLVKETAKAGLGTSAMIADNDPKIKEKVIQALKIAAKPAFTDIKVDWKSNSNALEFQCPRPPISGNIYEEESFDIYAIFSKKDLVESDIELSFFNTFNQDKGSVTLHIDPAKIVDAGDDDCTFKMAAKENIIHLKRSAEEGKEPSAEILGLSLMYSVLCDRTAFFGKIKNKEKSTEEMKTIKIPIKKYRDNAISKAPVFYGGPYGGITRKGLALGMKRWAAAAPSMMKCKTLSMNTAMRPQSAALERKNLQKRSRKPEAAMWKKEIWEGMLSILYIWSFCYYSSLNILKSYSIINLYEIYFHSNFIKIEEQEECEDILAFNDFEESKKSSLEKITATSSSSSISNNYQEIVSLQETDGSFKSLPDKYKSISKKECPAELEAVVTKKDNLALVWMTILALAILERDCQSSKGEWTMIAKKAKTYLKKNGVADFTKFVQLD